MKVVYIGECSGVSVDEIGLTFKRGVTVDAPDAWAREKILHDPERFRSATEEEVAKYDEAAAAIRAAEEEKRRQADEISLAHALEEEARLRVINEPATGGGGTGNEGAALPAFSEPVMMEPVTFEVPMTEMDMSGDPVPAPRRNKKKHEE